MTNGTHVHSTATGTKLGKSETVMKVERLQIPVPLTTASRLRWVAMLCL